MTIRPARWVLGLFLAMAMAVALHPVHAWAVGCCRCTACDPPRSPVFCVDTAGSSGDCNEVCLPDCPGTQTFDAEATCGVGAFANCLGAPAQPISAPAVDRSGIALAVAVVLGAEWFRRRRRMSGAA